MMKLKLRKQPRPGPHPFLLGLLMVMCVGSAEAWSQARTSNGSVSYKGLIEQNGQASLESDMTAYACEGQELKIQCPEPYESWKILKANYGRFSIAICNKDGRSDLSVNCHSPVTRSTLEHLCNVPGNMEACLVKADRRTFLGSEPDPCPDTTKYLEVHYRCIPKSGRQMDIKDWHYQSTKSIGVYGQGPVASKPMVPKENQTSSTRPRIPITVSPRNEDPPMGYPVPSPEEGTESPLTMTSEAVDLIITTFLTSTVPNIMDTKKAPEGLAVQQKSSEEASGSREVSGFKKPLEQEPSLRSRDDSTKSSPVYCNPQVYGETSWNQTLSSTIATFPCPANSTGAAYWVCDSKGRWMTRNPDLSQCRSIWLRNIRQQLEGLEEHPPIAHLANEMAHLAKGHVRLFGGDILLLLDTMEEMTNRLRQDLAKNPTSTRGLGELSSVVGGLLETASAALDPANLNTWHELGRPKKLRKSLTTFMAILENMGLLLLMVALENHEVAISTRNIFLSAKRINFSHMGRMHFPSSGSISTSYPPEPFGGVSMEGDQDQWKGTANMVEVPSLDLMQNMEMGGETHIVLLSYRNLELVMGRLGWGGDRQEDEYDKDAGPSDNSSGPLFKSGVISFTMGTLLRPDQAPNVTSRTGRSRLAFIKAIPASMDLKTGDSDKLAVPVRITFQMPVPGAAQRSMTCVHWNVIRHYWSPEGCRLTFMNDSHVVCSCYRLGTYALMDGTGNQVVFAHMAASNSNSTEDPMPLVIIVTSAVSISIAVILIVSMVILSIHSFRIKVSGVSTSSRQNWHHRLQEEMSPVHNRRGSVGHPQDPANDHEWPQRNGVEISRNKCPKMGDQMEASSSQQGSYPPQSPSGGLTTPQDQMNTDYFSSRVESGHDLVDYECQTQPCNVRLHSSRKLQHPCLNTSFGSETPGAVFPPCMHVDAEITGSKAPHVTQHQPIHQPLLDQISLQRPQMKLRAQETASSFSYRNGFIPERDPRLVQVDTVSGGGNHQWDTMDVSAGAGRSFRTSNQRYIRKPAEPGGPHLLRTFNKSCNQESDRIAMRPLAH